MAIVRKVVEKACKAAAKSTSNHSPAPHGGPNPLCGLVTKPKGNPFKMGETQNPDPNKKDIPDLTPDKDAKGGVGGGPPMHRKEK